VNHQTCRDVGRPGLVLAALYTGIGSTTTTTGYYYRYYYKHYYKYYYYTVNEVVHTEHQ